MLKQWSSFIFSFCILSNAFAMNNDSPCQVILQNSKNLSAESYTLTSARNFATINDQQHGWLEKDLKTLSPGSLIVDPGSGWAAADIELAHRGFRVHAINLQDFYLSLEKAAEGDLPLTSDLNGKVVLIGHMSALNIRSLQEALGVPLPNGWSYGVAGMGTTAINGVLPGPASTKVAQEFFRQLIAKKNALEAEGNFKYEVADAEHAIEKLGNESVDRFYENYGATYYSENRIRLLELMWQKLKVGGKASLNLTGLMDKVFLSGQSPNEGIAFCEWLQKNYPQYFEYEPGFKSRGKYLLPYVYGHSQLIMTRGEGDFPLKEKLQIYFQGLKVAESPIVNRVVIPVNNYLFTP